MSNAGSDNVFASAREVATGKGEPPPASSAPADGAGSVAAECAIGDRANDVEASYRSFIENAVEGIYRSTPEGRYLGVNPALARIYGYPSPEVMIESFTDIARQLYVDPQRRDDFKRLMAENGVVRDFQAEVFRRDGSVIWITENARCIRDASGAVHHYEGTVEDITERKRIEQENRLLATVFDSVADGVLIIDGGSIVQAVNRALMTITGFPAEDLVGGLLSLFARSPHDRSFLSELLRAAAKAGHWQGEVLGTRRDGTMFPAWLHVAAVRDGSGAVQHYVVVCSDITQRKQDEERIRYQAHYDSLTSLPNRHLIMDRLGQAVLRARRNGTKVCALSLDLKRFKSINDSYGHAAGDELLRLVSRRLRHCVRTSDTVGRLGGDEFIVILPDVVGSAAGTCVAEKILYSFSEPFQIACREIFCSVTIGITTFPEDADSVEGLIRSADVAMYHAKHHSEERYVLYHAAMGEPFRELLDLEQDLRHALLRGEFVLHFQPKVTLDDGRLVGAEALIRWHHPRRGPVSPGEFIPLAERIGLIGAIGRWTLREACRQVMAWRQQGIHLPSVSVNVSARQFQGEDLVETVQAVLVETGIEPGALDLELTESSMTGDVEKAAATLTALKAMGVTLSIDDFGTGYSSLSYLKSFPIDTLKIDQSFIRDVVSNGKDAAIVSTIIGLAGNLGFSVIAEEVETPEQADALRARLPPDPGLSGQPPARSAGVRAVRRGAPAGGPGGMRPRPGSAGDLVLNGGGCIRWLHRFRRVHDDRTRNPRAVARAFGGVIRLALLTPLVVQPKTVRPFLLFSLAMRRGTFRFWGGEDETGLHQLCQG